MKKLSILLITLIILLCGCSTQTDEQILANQSKFNIVFDEINHETNTATFTVSGLPNEEEFVQIQSVIVTSMNENNPEKDTKYTVYVYTDLQAKDGNPIYGTLVYQNGKIIQGTLTNMTQEQYISLSETATITTTSEN